MKFRIGSTEIEINFGRCIVVATKIQLHVEFPSREFLAKMAEGSGFFKTLPIIGRAAENVQKVEMDWYLVGGVLYPRPPRHAVVKDGGHYKIGFEESYLGLAYFGTSRRVSPLAEYFHAHRIGDGALLDLNFGEDYYAPS